MKLFFSFLIFFGLSMQIVSGQSANSYIWSSDNGDGTYSNPILHMDYSDPDAIRVGDDYYMTASSFNCAPGLPILHSKDLVNWDLVNYALPKQVPFEVFETPQHGNGVWAPCIRFHEGEFYIYYPDPDFGIYMIKTEDPKGTWSEPVLVKSGKGLIDPTPLWDDDGKVYLSYAFAGSRAGIKSLLFVCTMNSDGTVAFDDELVVIDGHKNEPTIEGPKFYKRNGYYYIFAPAGGVPTGWQTTLRSKNVFGPYETKKVLHQGNTKINGPHQGAWVTTQTGQDWFLHFQDKDAYGRIVHLQPMRWENDWPVMGVDQNDDGIGEPVLIYKKPNVGKEYPKMAPPTSDEFNDIRLGLQWQWHANPKLGYGFPASEGIYKLYCRPKGEDFVNLYSVPNLLLQKFPSETFTATTKLTFNARAEGEKTGLLVMGLDYAYIGLEKRGEDLFIQQVSCTNADKASAEKIQAEQKLKSSTVYLKVEVDLGGICTFYFSENNEKFKKLGAQFKAREGKWIGAKVGLFATSQKVFNDSGNADVDWFRLEKLNK